MVNYLPAGVKTALLSRSIFDYLCDIWYFPTISKILKAIIKPMVIKTDAFEAEKNLEELDVNLQLMIKTKGIVNVLPTGFQKALLPKGEQLKIAAPEPNQNENPSERHGEIPVPVGVSAEPEQVAMGQTFESLTLIQKNEASEEPKNPKKLIRAVSKARNMPRMKIISTNKTIKQERNKQSMIIASKWDRLEQFISHEKQKLSRTTQGVSHLVRFHFIGVSIREFKGRAAECFQFDPKNHPNQKWPIQTDHF